MFELQNNLKNLDTWEQKYLYILDLGQALPPLDTSQKIPANLVSDCQSRVWVVSKIEGGRLVLQGQSDSMLVKGLLALVFAVLMEFEPSQVVELTSQPEFVEKLLNDFDLGQNLSSMRHNGLDAFIKKIANQIQNLI